MIVYRTFLICLTSDTHRDKQDRSTRGPMNFVLSLIIENCSEEGSSG